MKNDAGKLAGRGGSIWRVVGWGAAALLLALPLAANAPWTGLDFILMGGLLAGAGLTFEFVARRSRGRAFRLGAGLALLSAFLTIWANAAVGLIGADDNPYNLLFGGVLAIALTGVVIARFRPAGMARAMIVTAAAQAIVSAFGLFSDTRGAVLSLGLSALWLLAAAAFRRAVHACEP